MPQPTLPPLGGQPPPGAPRRWGLRRIAVAGLSAAAAVAIVAANGASGPGGPPALSGPWASPAAQSLDLSAKAVKERTDGGELSTTIQTSVSNPTSRTIRVLTGPVASGTGWIVPNNFRETGPGAQNQQRKPANLPSGGTIKSTFTVRTPTGELPLTVQVTVAKGEQGVSTRSVPIRYAKNLPYRLPGGQIDRGVGG